MNDRKIEFYEYSSECLEEVSPLVDSLLLREADDDINIANFCLQAEKVYNRLEEILSAAVLHQVALYLLAELPASLQQLQHREKLNQILCKCGLEAVLGAICRILTDLANGEQSLLVTCLPFLLAFIRRHFLSGADHQDAPPVHDSCSPRGFLSPPDTDYTVEARDSIISHFLRIPTLISNACLKQKLQLPSWAVRNVFFSKLLLTALVFELGDDKAERNRWHEQQAMLIGMMVRRLVVNLAASEVVARTLETFYSLHRDPRWVSRYLWSSLSTRRDTIKLLCAIFEERLNSASNSTVSTDVSSKEVEQMCRQDIVPFIQAYCLPCLNANPLDLTRQFARTILMSRSGTQGSNHHSDLFVCTLTLILQSCKPSSRSESDDYNDTSDDESRDRPILELVIQDSSKVWAQRHFIQHTDLAVQDRVTCFLLFTLPLLQGVSCFDDVFGRDLVPGVTVRLESSQDRVRRHGMQVAEEMAKLFGHGDTLHFSDLHNENAEESPNEAAASVQQNRSIETPRSSQRRRRQHDPEAEFVSSSDDESCKSGLSDEASLEWEEDLVPLNSTLHDDEQDLLLTPKPVYLRECLELLYTPENHDLAASRHETSLKHLEELVRSRPHDLADVAIPLVRQLLHMDNKFGMEDFEKIVHGSLVSIIVGENTTALVILDQVFGDCSLQVRLQCLSVLERAAHELSGGLTLQTETGSHRGRLLDSSSDTGSKIFGSHRHVKGNGGDKIRRWGWSRRDPQKSTIVNRFTPLAPCWFYTLVGTFMERKDDVSLWGGSNGARLLSSLLVSLSSFVEASGAFSAGTWLLARDLYEFAWTFRSSQDSTLRLSVLVAMSTSLASVDESTFVQVLVQNGNSVEALPEFLSSIMESDPDTKCREAASVISTSVIQALSRSYALSSRSLLHS
jgi:hypothetical protein